MLPAGKIIKKEYFLKILGGLAIFAALYSVSLRNYLVFHSLAEVFSITVAAGIFMLAWTSRGIMDNEYLLLIGIAYLFVGFLDLIHTLSYTGMGITNTPGSNVPTQLWIAARYMQSASLLLGFLFLKRKLPRLPVMGIYAAATALIIASIFYWKIFPESFAEGSGLTPFKIASEYFVITLLGLSLYLLYRKRNFFSPYVAKLLGASVAVTVLSELSFTLYSDAYGFFNALGHFLKIISFYLIYKAVIEIGVRYPADVLFRELKQSRRLIKIEREKLLSILDSMKDGIYVVNKNHDIEYINPALKKEFGGIDNLKCYEYMEGRNCPCPRCNYEKIVSGSTIQGEFASKKTGQVYDVLETPLKNPDGMVSKLKIFRNITQRKKAEEILAGDKKTLKKLVDERTAELLNTRERLTHARHLSDIGRLASTVAHELRNPLGAIKAALFNIKRKNENSALEKHINTIDRKLTSSAAIIDDLLNYSKIRKPEYKNVSLKKLIDESTEELTNTENTKGVEIRKTFDVPAEKVLRADPNQLKQVVDNLLRNAVQAIDKKNGAVNIVVSSGKQDDEFSIIISDNGPGIDKDDLKNIFDPFFSKKSNGTGLGLSVCKQIITAHGGSIGITSTKGEGTTVYTTLPSGPK